MMTDIKVKQVAISTITPYHRNPRKNENAVPKVAKSIKQYGFNQPITVDKDNVIVTGHTRYKAAQMLGFQKVPVVVLDLPKSKITEYRIADNKTSEFARWDNDFLIPELREVSNIGEFNEFFTEDLNALLNVTESFSKTNITPQQVEVKKKQLEEKYDTVQEKHEEDKLDLICPCCGEEFQLSVASIQSAIKYN